MEAHFETGPRAPLLLGGWPDMDAKVVHYAVPIPGGLSFLAFNDPDAVVRGLDQFPQARLAVRAGVHFSFQLMVALGTYMALVALWAAWLALRRRDHASHRWFLRALALATPMGFIAIEAGWTVTEVGRQPWIVYGILRTADAVTPMPGLIVPFCGFTLLYCFLGVIVVGCCIARSSAARAHRMEPALRAGRKPCLTRHWPTWPRILTGALAAYVLFGGADFGGGVWDLLASGPRRARQRELIAQAIGADLGGQPRLAHPCRRADSSPAFPPPSPGSASCCTFRSR